MASGGKVTGLVSPPGAALQVRGSGDSFCSRTNPGVEGDQEMPQIRFLLSWLTGETTTNWTAALLASENLVTDEDHQQISADEILQ